MSAARILILFSSLVAITCALIFVFIERHRAIGPDVQNMTVAIGAIVISVVGIVLVLRRLFKEKKYIRFGIIAFIAAFCCLVGWVFGEAGARARCETWDLIRSTTLKGLAQIRREEIRNGTERLTPLHGLLTSEYGKRVIDDYCGCLTSQMVKEAKHHPPAPDDAWEKVGPYVLARRRELWTAQSRYPLLAYALSKSEWEEIAIYSGNMDALYWGDDRDLSAIKWLIDDAIALGASPPPDDVVDEVQRWLSSKGR